MSALSRSILLLACLAFAGTSGCAGTQGNRRPGRPMFTRVTDLRGSVGKVVTLVGTARAGGVDGSSIDLRGGTVELPAYDWPAGFVDHPVEVTGTLIDSHVEGDPKHGTRVYRLGEIEDAKRWSR
jgi:hypothetical protein